MANKSSNKSSLDAIKWVVIAILLIGGVVANYYYAEVPVALRAAGWIVLLCVIAGLAFLTTWGRGAWDFVQASRGELRKVVWPTRQETVQMTAIVMGLVAIMAIILWAVDSALLWLVRLLT